MAERRPLALPTEPPHLGDEVGSVVGFVLAQRHALTIG
jgi:hypothetical protein